MIVNRNKCYKGDCCHCNKINEKHERIVMYENDIYCVDCFIKIHKFDLCCSKCGYGYEPYERFVEVDGLYFCEYCAIDEFEYKEC